MLNGMFHRMLGPSLYDAFIVSVADDQKTTYFFLENARFRLGEQSLSSLVHLALSHHFKHGQSTASCVCILASGTGSIALASCILLYFISALFFGGKAFEVVFISPPAKTRQEDQKSCEDLGIYFSRRSPVTSRTAAAEHSWFDIAYSITYY
jgi:hypothetical protein